MVETGQARVVPASPDFMPPDPPLHHRLGPPVPARRISREFTAFGTSPEKRLAPRRELRPVPDHAGCDALDIRNFGAAKAKRITAARPLRLHGVGAAVRRQHQSREPRGEHNGDLRTSRACREHDSPRKRVRKLLMKQCRFASATRGSFTRNSKISARSWPRYNNGELNREPIRPPGASRASWKRSIDVASATFGCLRERGGFDVRLRFAATHVEPTRPFGSGSRDWTRDPMPICRRSC